MRSSSNRAGQWFNSGLSVKVNVLEQDNLTRLDTEDAASVLGWLTLLLMDCSIVAAVLVELCMSVCPGLKGGEQLIDYT